MLQYLLAPLVQCVDYNGHPLTSGHIEVYIHGTSTKYITKADWDGHNNPFEVPLDEKGICTLIATSENTYDIYCYDAHGVLQWSRSNVNTCGYSAGTVTSPLPTVSSDDTFTIVASSQRPDGGTNYGISLSSEFLDRIDTIDSWIGNLRYQVDSIINDLNRLYRMKQDVLTAGDGIDITMNVISATGGGSSSNSNVMLKTAPLMTENGNIDFTGEWWGGSGEWNTPYSNNTTRYYRVTSEGQGTVTKVRIWNYHNTNGKVRVCLMALDGTLKAQSDWHVVDHTGLYELNMVAEEGQDATIRRNTEYWIGICAYRAQFVAYTKEHTSFNENSLRYAVCIRNGGEFPCTGTGWDNPNTDAVNSVPMGVPIVYMLANG